MDNKDFIWHRQWVIFYLKKEYPSPTYFVINWVPHLLENTCEASGFERKGRGDLPWLGSRRARSPSSQASSPDFRRRPERVGSDRCPRFAKWTFHSWIWKFANKISLLLWYLTPVILNKRLTYFIQVVKKCRLTFPLSIFGSESLWTE